MPRSYVYLTLHAFHTDAKARGVARDRRPLGAASCVDNQGSVMTETGCYAGTDRSLIYGDAATCNGDSDRSSGCDQELCHIVFVRVRLNHAADVHSISFT
jgi:hypothetical protein